MNRRTFLGCLAAAAAAPIVAPCNGPAPPPRPQLLHDPLKASVAVCLHERRRLDLLYGPTRPAMGCRVLA